MLVAELTSQMAWAVALVDHDSAQLMTKIHIDVEQGWLFSLLQFLINVCFLQDPVFMQCVVIIVPRLAYSYLYLSVNDLFDLRFPYSYLYLSISDLLACRLAYSLLHLVSLYRWFLKHFTGLWEQLALSKNFLAATDGSWRLDLPWFTTCSQHFRLVTRSHTWLLDFGGRFFSKLDSPFLDFSYSLLLISSFLQPFEINLHLFLLPWRSSGGPFFGLPNPRYWRESAVLFLFLIIYLFSSHFRFIKLFFSYRFVV